MLFVQGLSCSHTTVIKTVVGQVGELKLSHVNEPSLDRCFKAALQNGVYVLTNIKDAKELFESCPDNVISGPSIELFFKWWY